MSASFPTEFVASLAEVIASLFITRLFPVPPISPESCTLHAAVVVACGLHDDDEIAIESTRD